MKIIIFWLLFLQITAFSEDSKEMKTWLTMVEKLHQKQEVDLKNINSQLRVMAIEYYKHLPIERKIALVKENESSSHEGASYIAEAAVVDALESDDLALLQLVIRLSCPQSVRGYSIFEYLAKHKEGRYVPVMLCAYKSSTNVGSKYIIYQSLNRYFGVPKKAKKREVYIETCVVDFIKKQMWKSDEIRKLGPFKKSDNEPKWRTKK